MTSSLSARTTIPAPAELSKDLPAATALNREEWLIKATDALRPLFVQLTGQAVPECHVSVGWPSKGGTAKNKTIGQAWSSTSSADGIAHVFISPIIFDGETALATLIHELCHVVLDCEFAHRSEFACLAKAMGLEGKMTATIPGSEALIIIAEVISEIGTYPHAALTPGTGGAKKQTTRQIKVECPFDGYLVRMTRKWIDAALPTCPLCDSEMVADIPAEEGE